MPAGIAIRKGPAPDRFYAGSALFQLFPSLSTFEGRDDYVVVAHSPSASDHGLPETTVFKCDSRGGVSAWGGLSQGAEALLPHQRIIGRFDIEAALGNLSGTGYFEVAEVDLEALKQTAYALAKAYGLETFFMDDRDACSYAAENWGHFAARHLVATGQRHQAPRIVNHMHNLPAPAGEIIDI